uniref:RanBD1 domain-containing protein n=1 Tax=Lutzomyia longipalpis TaxID=7200 RepID=A0A1B0GHT6_LUTLO
MHRRHLVLSQLAKSPEKPAVEVGKDILKMDENLSFASLAKAGGAASDFLTKETKEGKTGFFGLSYSDDFRHFGGSAAAAKSGEENGTGNDDSNYDPHYEPLIPLPDEIKVSTGEEEEILLFNQFSNLYRFDFTNKEWKERGTGYMKILHHPVKGTYRFVMRRDQVHKLVLSHAITAEFNIAPMNKTGRSFCWAAVNYAEDPAQTENLAIRFKTANVATDFEKVVNECIQKLKEKGDLEPEED